MIDPSHDLSIRRQAELVNISRGSAYRTAVPVSDADLELMRRINELHLELPFAGARMLRGLLRGEGIAVGRKHMTTLMRRMAEARTRLRSDLRGVLGGEFASVRRAPPQECGTAASVNGCNVDLQNHEALLSNTAPARISLLPNRCLAKFLVGQ